MSRDYQLPAIIGLIAAAAVMFAGCMQRAESSERASFNERAHYSMDIAADPDTGCEYLIRHNEGITPRIAADGKTHMGCKGPKP